MKNKIKKAIMELCLFIIMLATFIGLFLGACYRSREMVAVIGVIGITSTLLLGTQLE